MNKHVLMATFAGIMGMFGGDSNKTVQRKIGKVATWLDNKRNASKSQRIMRAERGHQKDTVGMRRIGRYVDRARKRRHSFGNNIALDRYRSATATHV